jgi:hypothetical protein
MELCRLSPEIEWAQVDPGCGPFFPPVHGGTTLAFSVSRWPGELFALWLPENIHGAGVHSLRVEEEDWRHDAGAGRLSVNGRSLTGDGSAVCAFAAEVHPVTHGLRLLVRMKNLTSRVWSDPWVNICVQLAHAPSFDDPAGTRTFVRFGGRWTPLSVRSILDHRSHYRIVLTQRRSASMLEHLSAENVMTAEPADHNLVVVTDPVGLRSVGCYSPEAVVLVFNGSEGVRCIHSNPAALPCDIPPGQEAVAESFLLFLDGPLEKLVELVGGGPAPLLTPR